MTGPGGAWSRTRVCDSSGAEDVGVWSANTDHYVLRSTLGWRGLGGFPVVSRIGFRVPSGKHFYALQDDSRGLIWALTNVPDPDDHLTAFCRGRRSSLGS